MRRRTFLATSSAVIGLGGYHQRRRLKRWDDRGDLQMAWNMSDPSVPGALISTESHLRSAYDSLVQLVENAKEAGERADEMPESYLEKPIEVLETTNPETFSDLSATERETVLDELRGRRYSAGQALAVAKHELGEIDPDSVTREINAFLERVDETEYRYEADDLSTAIVQYAMVDDVYRSATGFAEQALDRLKEDPDNPHRHPYAATFGNFERAKGMLDDTRQFAAAIDGSDVTDQLDELYHRVQEETNAAVEEVSFRYDDERHNWAARRWSSLRVPPQDGSNAYRNDALALATRTAIELFAQVQTLPEFEDVPPVTTHTDSDEVDATGADVLAARKSITDEYEGQLETDGDNRLVRHLLTDATSFIRSGDARVTSSLRQINELSTRHWVFQLEVARQLYRQTAVYPDYLPEVLAIVDEQSH